jgi:hypothetical protein
LKERQASESKVDKVASVGESERKADKEEGNPNIVTVNLRWGGVVYLEDHLLKRRIRIHVKTFFGAREKYTVDAEISDTIQTVKNKVIELAHENSKNLANLRLVYPMGYINELSTNANSLESYRIPDHANLLLLVQMSFTWEPSMKAPAIKVFGRLHDYILLVVEQQSDSE